MDKNNNSTMPEFVSVDDKPLEVKRVKTPELVDKDSVPVSPEKSLYDKDAIVELIKKFAETCDELKVINNKSK